MNQPNNREYYLSRAIASRNLAQHASDPQIARIHADFARHYEAAAQSDRPSLRIVE